MLLVPVVRFHKAEPHAAKFPIHDVEELKFVVAPIEIFEGTFPLPVLKNKPLIVPFEPDVEIEPVTPKDPVISADPVYGNAGPPPPPPPFNANEAVPKSEPVNDVAVKEPEIFTVFKAKSPFISGVPEPEAIYSLLFSSVNVEGPAANPIAILFEELPEKQCPAFCPNAILLHPVLVLRKA